MGAYIYQGIGHEIDQDAAWDYIRDGYLLAPRTVLSGRTKLPPSPLPVIPTDLNNIAVIVEQELQNAIGNMAGLRRAVMFSGGFDSVLIALLTQRCGAQMTAVTVRFDDFNPVTVGEAVRLAKEMEFPHQILHVTVPEFLSAFELLAGIMDEPILDLDLVIVYAALRKYDPRIAGKVFISGMGSDQWFGNHSLELWPGGFAAQLDWAIVNQSAHQRVAQAHGYSFVFPFLSAPMLTLSQQVPPAMKKDKKLLRELAARSTIPPLGARSEIQVPDVIRRILVKVYGSRAWPGPVSGRGEQGSVDDQTLRKIVLGLWFEKVKDRITDL